MRNDTEQRQKLGKMNQQELAELLIALGGTTGETGTASGLRSKPLLIERILSMQHAHREQKRAEREARLWIVALVSAVASVVSAFASWAAVLAA